MKAYSSERRDAADIEEFPSPPAIQSRKRNEQRVYTPLDKNAEEIVVSERVAAVLLATVDTDTVTTWDAEELLLTGRWPRINGEQFLLLNKIGDGGFGTIYRARQDNPKREVAIKAIRTEQSPERKLRADREIQYAGEMSDIEQFVTVFCAWQIEDKHYRSDNAEQWLREYQQFGSHFLVMPNILAPTLQRVIKQHGGLPIAETLDIMLRAAKGLLAAHEKCIIHRDINPKNIFYDAETGMVKILDLGMARRYKQHYGEPLETFEKTMTRDEAFLGTLGYMSPEQYDDPSGVDFTADAYSLGLILYALLNGKALFSEITNVIHLATAHNNHHRPPLLPQNMQKGIPSNALKLLKRLWSSMVNPDPSKRPQDRGDPQTTMKKVIEGIMECQEALSQAI